MKKRGTLSAASILLLALLLSCLAGCDALTGAAGAAGADGEDATAPTFVYTPPASRYSSLCAGGGVAVACGSFEFDNATYYMAAYRSSGSSWSSAGSAPSGAMNAIAYGNGTFVGVGAAGAISYSADGGQSWTAATSGAAYNLGSVAYGAGRFVAAGSIEADGESLLTSADGIAWSPATPPYEAAFTNCFFVTYVNNRFIAIVSGDSIVFESTDGTTWSERASFGQGGDPVVGIVQGNGIFLLVCQNGSVLRSADFAEWKTLVSPDSGAFTGVAFDGSRFNLSKSDGSIYSTVDGSSWRYHSLSPSYTYGRIVWAADMDGGVFMIPRAGT